MLRISIVTIFPEFFATPLALSIPARAAAAGSVSYSVIDLRDFTHDRSLVEKMLLHADERWAAVDDAGILLFERGLEGEQLGPAAHRGRADSHARLDRGGADERVARIVTFEVCPHGKPGRIGRGHVLRGVYGDVDPPSEEGLLDLLHEHAAIADLAER